MRAKHVVIKAGPSDANEARIVLFHFIDQRIDFAASRGGRCRMSRRLAAEREMRLIRPFEIGFFKKLMEQQTVFFRCHNQGWRFIGHELSHRQLPGRRRQRLASEMQ